MQDPTAIIHDLQDKLRERDELVVIMKAEILRLTELVVELQERLGQNSSNSSNVVGRGVILHHDGKAWTQMDPGTKSLLTMIWGTGPTDVFAVGEAGLILHRCGK